jgi:hypothetical protein
MAPSKTVLKSVTPDSVKALMILEAVVIAFFSIWIYDEYVYNVYFQIYVNNVFVAHFTSYTIALGLGIGLAGTAVAATLYKNLREAKVKLGSVAPKIRGSVGKLLASVPTIETQAAAPGVVASQPAQETMTTAIVVSRASPSRPVEEKK